VVPSSVEQESSVKSGRRLFGKELSRDEVLTGFIRNLIDRCFPAVERSRGKNASSGKDGSSAKVPSEDKKKGKSAP
jgi:hypothetical protein